MKMFECNIFGLRAHRLTGWGLWQLGADDAQVLPPDISKSRGRKVLCSASHIHHKRGFVLTRILAGMSSSIHRC